MTDVITKTAEQLAREDVERQTLEAAAKRLESQTYFGETYRKAMKTAAQVVRAMKDKVGEVHPQCTDNGKGMVANDGFKCR